MIEALAACFLARPESFDELLDIPALVRGNALEHIASGLNGLAGDDERDPVCNALAHLER